MKYKKGEPYCPGLGRGKRFLSSSLILIPPFLLFCLIFTFRVSLLGGKAQGETSEGETFGYGLSAARYIGLTQNVFKT